MLKRISRTSTEHESLISVLISEHGKLLTHYILPRNYNFPVEIEVAGAMIKPSGVGAAALLQRRPHESAVAVNEWGSSLGAETATLGIQEDWSGVIKLCDGIMVLIDA